MRKYTGYEIEEGYGSMKIKLIYGMENIKSSISKGDCYVLGYEDAPESGNIAVSTDIEIVVKKLIEEMNSRSHYWYEISSWENGNRIDGDQYRGA